MTRTRTAGVVLGVLALTATACGGSGGGAAAGDGTPVDGKTFSLAIGSDPGSHRPAHDGACRWPSSSTGSSTTRCSGFDDGRQAGRRAGREVGGHRPRAATFTLRPGLTCADGAPLTAADVAANINFIGDPANKSPIAGLYIAPGTKATADEATRTITVTSGKPDAFLLRNIGGVPIACAKGLSRPQAAGQGRERHRHVRRSARSSPTTTTR